MTTVADLPTPALIVDRSALEANLATMAATLPGGACRPHVKAHKTTGLARLQRDAGHPGFTAQTVREAEGLHRAGLAQDVLLSNEILLGGAKRVGALVEAGARVTLAVDSRETVLAAAAGGVREVVIDVNVGLPRCGAPPEACADLAALARAKGLSVRGVMGYEGHLMIVEDGSERAALVAAAMEGLRAAHDAVGGELVSAGGTGTYQEHAALGLATEVQAGSYLLMDTYYAKLGLPFRQAVHVLGTVVSTHPGGWAVVDVGLKALGMDHGNPSVAGHPVWLVSDEHTTMGNTVEQGAPSPVAVGDLVRVVPAHVDPTVSQHEVLHLVDGDGPDAEVLDRFEVDLRGW
jgi:D-serine deaminase-like pyridoxal phosphate-dependent protein